MRAHVGWDKSSKSHRTIAKKVGQLHHSWPSSLFHRLFCRLEVGQLGQLHPFPPFLREGEVSPEPPSVFIGRRRDFKATNASKKVGQIGQVPYFIGFCCRLEVGQLGKLHPFPPLLREGKVPPEPTSVFIGRRRDFKATNTSKKVGKVGQVPYFIDSRCSFEVGQVDQLRPSCPFLREGEVPPEPTSVFVGWRRVFEATNTSKKVGKVGQVPYFIDSRCSFEVGQVDQLRPSCPFLREGEVPPEPTSVFVGWRRDFEAHESIKKS